MKYLSKLSTQIGISLFLMIFLSFFWWQAKFSTKKILIDSNDNKSIPSLNIEGAKYSGFSQNGQKFSVSAKLITENKSKINVLNLKSPNAIFETKKSLITISSNIGEFDINNKNLSLSENVSFIDENLDFTLTSNELNGNLGKGEFYSTKPVYFDINSGFLKSENFFYNQNEKKVIFSGRTKLVFFK